MVRAAGRVPRSETATQDGRDDALAVLSVWRAMHARPLDAFQTHIRDRLRGERVRATAAQRLKRTPDPRTCWKRPAPEDGIGLAGRTAAGRLREDQIT